MTPALAILASVLSAAGMSAQAGSPTQPVALHVRVLPPPSGCQPVAPPFVFLPALGFTGESFEEVGQRISSCRARVLVDLPGMGQSEPRDIDVASVDAATVVGSLSRLLTRVGPAILVGHSLGGVIAVRLAAERPASVKALILLDAPLAPFSLAWWQRAALHPLLWSPSLHIIGAVRATRFALHRLHEHPAAGASASIRVLSRELSTRSSRRVLLAYHRSFLEPSALRLAELDLARIHVPVLLLWGSHDHVVPKEMVGEIIGALPAGTRVTTRLLPTGHLAPLEKPDQVASAISMFADDLAPAARARSPAASQSSRRGAALAPARR